jgi:membrane protease YdiL (CAAX protease family)
MVPRRRLALAIALYATLAACAMLWSGLRGDWTPWTLDDPLLPGAAPTRATIGLALGFALGLLTVCVTRVLVRRTMWARELHREFRALLGPVSRKEIAAYALLSGVAEELFFRGALMPTVGVVASSLIFGILHVGPSRRCWTWTVWATVMGFLLAGIARLTGDLYGPVLAHVLINYENLHFIDTHDPDALDALGLEGRPADASAPPRLLTARAHSRRTSRS